MSLIQREVFNWGVRLTARPYEGHKTLGGMSIFAEIAHPKPSRTGTVKITFTAALASAPLGVSDVQAWQNALSAVLTESRQIVAEMKTAESTSKSAKRKKK